MTRARPSPVWRRWALTGVLAGACYGLHLLGVVVVVSVLAGSAALAIPPDRARPPTTPARPPSSVRRFRIWFSSIRSLHLVPNGEQANVSGHAPSAIAGQRENKQVVAALWPMNLSR